MYSASDYAAHMENLVRGSQLVEESWEAFFWEPEYVEQSSTNIEHSSENPWPGTTYKDVTLLSTEIC